VATTMSTKQEDHVRQSLNYK